MLEVNAGPLAIANSFLADAEAKKYDEEKRAELADAFIAMTRSAPTSPPVAHLSPACSWPLSL